MPEAASVTSLDPVVLMSSGFRHLKFWTLDDYGIHAAARLRSGFSRIPFELVMPARRRLSRCLFVMVILIAIATVHGLYHYLADAICDAVVDRIVPVLVPAEMTSASLSTSDDTLYVVPPIKPVEFPIGGYLLHSGNTWIAAIGSAKQSLRIQDLVAT
jgi:xanthine/CO dehydrogenase XdhC/CoxF family maturation factor